MPRDLLRHFCKGPRVPEPLTIQDVPLVNNVHELHFGEQSILNLNELLEAIHTDFVDHFDSMMGESPRDFWQQVRPDDPRLSNMEEITSIDGWEDITYPCILHGDGGVYTRKTESSILVVSLKSMLAKKIGGSVLP